MLAVQGPEARALVARARRRRAAAPLHGPPSAPSPASPDVLVCGTGYTGEDGVELMIAARAARPPCGTRSSPPAPTPVGLGARDTLRLEACFHLYGNDLSEDRGPIEAGLGWCCKEATGFIGAERVAARPREQGTAERLVPFAITGPGIARQGNPVIGGGVVTSGTLSPTLGYGIGLAYLPADRTEPGTAVRDRRAREDPRRPKSAPSH